MIDMEQDSEALPRSENKSGYLGVKVTKSGKFQPQIFTKTGVPQRGLGSFEKAVDAARALAAAKAKIKRNETQTVWQGPVDVRAARGSLCAATSRTQPSNRPLNDADVY